MDRQSSIEIEVRGLRKSFDNLLAVSDLSFAAPAGQIFGLVGPDGAGKSTTIRMLTGILPPDAGEVRVAGCDVVAEPEAVKSLISYMPQRFGLYEDLTVDENIRFYADLFGVARRQREQRAEVLLKACAMDEFRRRLAGKLSGGMKQKLGLVCALIHTPRVLLLDEPTTGVDPVSRREFWAMLYTLLGQGVTILVSTSYLDEAERCHQLALLHQGRLLICDRPESLRAHMTKAVLSVVSSEAGKIKQLLDGAAGISDAIVVGDSIHVFVDDASLGQSKIKPLLDTARIPYSAIEPILPTIEDFFVDALARGGYRGWQTSSAQ
ncbi:MAG: ABC transporter ATP-binding protein [Deltaproteobacteria bacterium]|nr:ABC transporter ATP-binding protein [Deltaproteobacteria bacterium]